MIACMIICHFNDPHLIYAIASLRNQEKRVHIILVDDDSNLQSRKAYANVRNVHKIELPENKGVGYARNAGLRLAFRSNCDFIGFLDSDGVAHPSFIKEAVKTLDQDRNLSGVCAKKGIANSKVRIARVKYHYKIYKKDSFQLDCSLFRKEAFAKRQMPDRRAGEDSVFILSFKPEELAKLGIPYYHFERDNVKDFFRDEYYGAYYGYRANSVNTLKQLLLTPFTSLKMILAKHWILEGLLFPYRQLVWLVGYLNGSRLVQ